VSGTGNTSAGFGSLSGLSSGGSNIALGQNAGSAVTTVSNTINIGNTGANTDAQIAIGTPGTHTSCIIAGIQGVAPGGTPQMVVVNPSTSQLGSQAIPASGVTTVGAISATSNSNGATITGTTLNLAVADSNNGGVLSTTSQNIAGDKVFVGNITTNSNLNTGNTALGGGNLIIGDSRLHNYSTAVGTRTNVFLGNNTGNYTNSSANNVGIGAGALSGITSGGVNVCLGQNAGNALTTTSNNILVANTGTVTDSGVIKIGVDGTQTSTFIAGIQGVAPGGTPQMVVINPTTSQLGSQAISASGATTVGAISASSTANGASITGTTLNLAPADATNGGVVTNTTQSFAGNKTFAGSVTANQNVSLSSTSSNSVGNVVIGTLFLHNYSSNATKSNVFLGYSVGNYTNSSLNNVGIGNGALSGITSGGVNIALGQNAGNALTTTSNNIHLANTGTVTDSGVIKIGTSGTHTSTFIAGIQGVAPGGTPQAVIINPSTGQLGSQTTITVTATTNFATATANSGSIVDMSVRTTLHLSSITANFTKLGAIVFMTLPYFSISQISGGPPTLISFPSLIPAGYLPTYDELFAVVMFNSSTTYVTALLTVPTTGTITLTMTSQAGFAVSFGLFKDLTVCWTIV
jgi:hypothetical protein